MVKKLLPLERLRRKMCLKIADDIETYLGLEFVREWDKDQAVIWIDMGIPATYDEMLEFSHNYDLSKNNRKKIPDATKGIKNRFAKSLGLDATKHSIIDLIEIAILRLRSNPINNRKVKNDK